MDKIWYLKQLNIFSELSDKEIRSIANIVKEKNVARKQIVFFPEDRERLFFLKTGQVEIYEITRDGRKIILDTLGPGNIFGTFSAPGEANFAQAQDDAFLCVAEKDIFLEYISSHPKLASKVVAALMDNLTSAYSSLISVSQSRATERVKYKLLDLGQKYGKKEDGVVYLNRKFSQEQIAQMVGLSRETVSRTLAKLKKQGIILKTVPQIVFNKEKLASL